MAVTSMGQSSIRNARKYNTFASAARFVATGGQELEANGYKIHIFRVSSNFVVYNGFKELEVFLVAGGGGGGSGTSYGQGGGGGGGGGQVLETVTSVPVGLGQYPILVGSGGAINTDGNDSSFLNFTALKGNKGILNGGAGGNSGNGFSGGAFSTYSGGGGAGASAAGGNASIYSHVNRQYTSVGGNGGAGITSDFSGSSLYYAGGGGGGATTGPYSFDGVTAATQGTSAGGQVDNQGGGGFRNTAGYSGVVIVRYVI